MTRGDDWLNSCGAERVDDPYTSGKLGMFAHLDGEHLRIDGRGIHTAIGDHTQRLLMETGFDDAPEEAVRLAQPYQRVPGDIIAGMGVGVVICPATATQV